MPRPNRIIFDNAVYHVFQRGNNKEYIFESPKAKQFFLKQIKEYNKKFDFSLLAYVIMDNHYHLIIKTGTAPIDKIMFYINNVFVKYINRELDRTGHVYDRRYNSKVVDNDAYLLWLLRYIHRNPIRGHICNNLDDYRWSSHFFYKNGINSFVNTGFILGMLSENKRQALKQYQKLVNHNTGETTPDADYELIKSQFKLDDSTKSPVNDNSPRSCIKTLDEIMFSLNIDDITKSLIKANSKKRNLTDYKIQFIQAALSNLYTMKEIGDYLCTTESAVSKLLTYHK